MRVLVLLATAAVVAQDPPPATKDPVADAVRALQGIDMRSLKGAAQRRANDAINGAWKTLRANKDRAVPALKKELQRHRAEQVADDFFRIEAGCLLYAMTEMDEIAAVAAAVHDIDPEVAVNLTFQLASYCSRSRDPRVLPILGAMLRTDRESPQVVFANHAFSVPWSLSLAFTWGPYGAGANDYLMTRLQSDDAKVRASALQVLTDRRHLPALEVCRKWATTVGHTARAEALQALGKFAVPADKDVLVAATRDEDADIRFAAAYGLYEFGDPATAPALRKLLEDESLRVRNEAIVAAAHVIDVPTGLAFARRLAATADEEERAMLRNMITSISEDTATDADKLSAGDEKTWRQATAAYWKQRDAFFELRPDDRKLEREEFLAAVEAWTEAHSMSLDEERTWIEARHLLSVATPDDIPRLRELRSSLLWRQSDEVLYEVRPLDRVLTVLHRRKVGAAKPNE